MGLKRNTQTITPKSFRETQQPPGWFELSGIVGLGLLVLALLTPHVFDWLNPPTGDEPFYLTTAITILRDHSLDESDSYLTYRFWEFAPTCEEMAKPHWGDVGPKALYSVPGVYAPGLRACPNTPSGFEYLPPHQSKETIRPGNYTKHGLGLSFLIIPAYALAGRLGVMFFINLLAALVGVNCWLLAWEMTGRRGVAWLTWGAMLFTSPLLPFAFLIFPATPAALAVVYSWRRLRLVARARLEGLERNKPLFVEVNGPVRALLVGLCIGILPWLHSVYLSIAIPLFLYFVFGGRMRYWREWLPGWSPVPVALFLLPLILLNGLLMAFYLWLYGSPLPNTQDHAGFAPLSYLWNGLLGLLFDQKYGLLVYSPIYLLAFAGLVLLGWSRGDQVLTRRRRSDLIWLGVAVVPNYLVMSSYNQWWGEWGPPARYLVPLVPVLAAPLAVTLAEGRNWFSRIFLGLALLWSGIISVAWMYNPHLMYHWQDNNPAKLLTWLEDNVALFKGVNLAAWFPSYVTNLTANGSGPNYPAIILWIAAAWLIAALVVFLALRKPETVETEEIFVTGGVSNARRLDSPDYP
jgi:hypothetical protein